MWSPRRAAQTATRDDGHRLRLDGGQQQHILDHGHRREQRHWQRHVNYNVAANTRPARARDANVAGQTLDVTQAGDAASP